MTFDPPVQIPRSSSEVGVADFDHDGHPDIAITNSSQRWYAGPDFTDYYTIGISDGGPYAARVADINGDGWDDFITSDGSRTEADMPGNIYLYLNPGDTSQVYDPWERIIIYTGQVRHQNDMRIVDVDGDGLLDVIEKTWSNERVVVAFQNADINDWTVRAFDTGETGKPEGISAGDIDGDGETEIVLSGVYWDADDWRIDTPTEHLIDTQFVQEEVKSAVGDIDNDGDNDVYMGSCEGGYIELAWYENTGLDEDGIVIFQKHVIKPNTGKYHMVELIDIDFDGDLDLATGKSFGDDGATIFYNENNGASWTEDVYDPDGNLYTGIVADLDGDGDLDVVGPTGFYDPVVYYINTTPGDPPAKPDSTSASLIDGLSIEITWNDNSLNESSFQIEVLEGSAWISEGNTGVSISTYTDESTQPNTSYTYRVRAANAAGVSDWDSTEVVTTWNKAVTPTITPIGGNYTDPVEVSITSSDVAVNYYYTTDGSIPSIGSLLYQGPFLIESSSTLNVIAIGTMLIPSDIKTENYNIAINGNFPPFAVAGPDEIYSEFQEIFLDGSNSSDIDDPLESLQFVWTQLSGPSVSLMSSDSSVSSFLPSQAGLHTFLLSVSDEAETSYDTVGIDIKLLSDGLIAYWPADEESGVTIEEVVDGNDGTANLGVALAPQNGVIDGALLFDGTTGRVNCPSIDIVNDSLTICFWMKMIDTNNPEGRFISKATGLNGNLHNFMVSQISTSALRFRLNTSNGGTETLASSTGQIPVDEWIFVTARYDGSTMKLYRNVVEIASVNKTGNITSSSAQIGIGNQPIGAGDRPFSGYLDEIRLYNKALTIEEIQDIYDSSCSDYKVISDVIISEDTSVFAKQEIELTNVNISSGVNLILKSKEVKIDQNSIVNDGILVIRYGSGCN